MCPEDDVVTRARKKVQRQIEQAERAQRAKLLRRRIELATAGVRAYEKGNIPEAVQNYKSYLKILEDWKGVGENGLTPALFNPKKDIYEILLISAIYWDLAKLYDRTRTRKREFLQYMEKYILFSKGTPFQPLAAETLRKYISNDKGIHRGEFRNAYRLIGGDAKCFVATALSDVADPRTLPRLRLFRDDVLRQSRAGRAFIAWYYRNGPRYAERVSRLPYRVRLVAARVLDAIALAVSRL